MATISFTIPDAQLNRVLDGVAKANGYQDQIPDDANPGQMIPNPETKAQLAKRRIREIVKGWVAEAEGSTGYNTAYATAQSEIEIQD